MPKKFESCVEKLKNKKGINPYAVCSKSTGYVMTKGRKWKKK